MTILQVSLIVGGIAAVIFGGACYWVLDLLSGVA